MKYNTDFGVGMMLKGGGHVAPVFLSIFMYFHFVIPDKMKNHKKEGKIR
jgi:hypothetical protein